MLQSEYRRYQRTHSRKSSLSSVVRETARTGSSGSFFTRQITVRRFATDPDEGFDLQPTTPRTPLNTLAGRTRMTSVTRSDQTHRHVKIQIRTATLRRVGAWVVLHT